MDICFAIDSSGSIGSTNFQTQIDWLSDFVETSLSSDSRTGIIRFASTSEVLLDFSSSEPKTSLQLSRFVDNITWTAGWTYTVGAIMDTIDLFDSQSNDITLKIFVILTDGNPAMPVSAGDDATNVCRFASTLKENNIGTYIVGVGNGWTYELVDCLVSDAENDILEVDSFNYNDFDEILPQLTDITCPGLFEFLCCLYLIVIFIQYHRIANYNPN